MGLLHKQLTYALKGYFYDIHNTLGVGYDEETYHLALEKRLTEENIPFESKVTRYVKSHEQNVHKFVVDLVIDNKVILELKCIQNEFHRAHFTQILSYLKCWKLRIGFLVNFGLPKVNSKRVIYTPKTPNLIEDYSYIQDLINPTNRISLRQVRQSILSIFNIHGVGYDTNIYTKLLTEEFNTQNISFKNSTFIPITFGG